MKRDPTILERNLVSLFTRAYAPVQPSAAFRKRLFVRVGKAVEHRVQNEKIAAPIARKALALPARGAPARRRAAAWIVAAAAVFACIFVWFAWRNHGSSLAGLQRAQFLAQGRCAVREGAQDDWRTLTAAESARGVDFNGASLALATPTNLGARVWLGSQGRIDAQSSTEVQLAYTEDTPQAANVARVIDIRLEQGALTVERYVSGGAWRIATSHGTFAIERGAIEVACLDARAGVDGAESGARVRARLRSGTAWAEVGAEHIALALDADVYVRDGRVVATTEPDAADFHSQRTSLGSALGYQAPPPASAGAATANTLALHGRLIVPEKMRLPERIAVTLLRRERLPAVSQPETRIFSTKEREFSYPDVVPGVYAVFVEVEGFAVWRTRDLALAVDAQKPIETAPPTGHTTTVDLDVALESAATVRGKIVAADTGLPLEGALVVSEDDTPSQLLPLTLEGGTHGWLAAAKSHSDGTFELGALGPGLHILRATKDDFAAVWSEEIELDRGEHRDGVELALARGGTIEGKVAHDDGAPWPNAIVIASLIDSTTQRPCMSYGMCFADAQGHYSIRDLPAGDYVLLHGLQSNTTKEKTSPRVTQAHLAAGEHITIDLPGDTHGTELIGRVTTDSGDPLSDVDITLQPTNAKTHGESWQSERTRTGGTFTFADLKPGKYDVFVGEGMGTHFILQDQVEVPAVPRFEYALKVGTGEIHGCVRAAQTKAGLAHSVLILQVEKDGVSTFAGLVLSEEGGRYSFGGLRPGLYSVTAYASTSRARAPLVAQAPERREGSRAAKAPPFGPERIDGLSIRTTERVAVADFELHPGASLTVHVGDGRGPGIEGANVRFVDADGRAITFNRVDLTDVRGNLRIEGIKPGRWTISAAHAGFAGGEREIDLQAGDRAEVELVLQPSESSQ